MSDNEKKQVIPANVTRTHTRNGVTLSFKDDAFGKRSNERAGMPFLCPDWPTPILETVTRANGEQCQALVNIDGPLFVGINEYDEAVKSVVRRDIMVFWPDNLEEDGTWNDAAWVAYIKELSAAKESLSDVQDNIEKLQDRLTGLFNGENKDAEGASADDLAAMAASIAKQITPLKVKEQAISAKLAIAAARRKATKEAKEAQAQTATASA